jgi:hypothetical protein
MSFVWRNTLVRGKGVKVFKILLQRIRTGFATRKYDTCPSAMEQCDFQWTDFCGMPYLGLLIKYVYTFQI